MILRLLLSLTWATGLAIAADDLGDHPLFSHAMEVETRVIDEVPVLFQYGEVRPSFEAREGNPWRKRTSLDGEWELRFEGDEKTQKVEVPHCWEGMAGAKFWDKHDTSSGNPARFDGAGWYRRVFSYEKTAGKRYRLEFLGVRERARVFVNGQEVAMHEGLGAPFSIDVTQHLLSGENEVKLKVLRLPAYKKNEEGGWDELEGIHTPYPKAPDYWPYAGVTSSVSLWEEAETTVRKVQVATKGENLQVRVVVANQSQATQEARVQVKSDVLAEGTGFADVSLAPGEVRVARLSLKIAKGAKRWSPSSPSLYTLQTTLSQGEQIRDQTRLRSGLREFGVRGEELVLNGKPVFLKGAAMYSETEKGAVLSKEQHRDLFQLAKDAEANFVRLQVRQREPAAYQVADEMGLMVTGEWGGFWYKEKAMAAQTEDSNSVFQSMGRIAVWDLTNHPSVVMWCTNNECHQFCPEYPEFLKMNRAIVRELDEGMLPITWAAWHPYKGEPHFEFADIVGFNEYRGALDAFEDLEPDLKRVREENSGKPIVIMENGAWATAGKRGSKHRKGTEDWQADLLRRQWEVIMKQDPPLAGYTYWLLKDYRSRKSYTGNRRSDGWSRMGLYGIEGETKLVRDTFRDLDWSGE